MTVSLANQILLRPTQLSSAATAAGSNFASEATPTQANSNSSTSANQTDNGRSHPDDNEYTAGAMAGVGVGVGVPFPIVVCVLSWLLFREKRRQGRANGKSYTGVTQGSPFLGARDQAASYMYAATPVHSTIHTAEMAVKTATQELAVEAR
jgi:hypothetical protein